MKTLFEKLSEENKQKVIKNPYSTTIEATLKKDKYHTDMKLSDAFHLYWTIYPSEPFDLSEFFELFND